MLTEPSPLTSSYLYPCRRSRRRRCPSGLARCSSPVNVIAGEGRQVLLPLGRCSPYRQASPSLSLSLGGHERACWRSRRVGAQRDLGAVEHVIAVAVRLGGWDGAIRRSRSAVGAAVVVVVGVAGVPELSCVRVAGPLPGDPRPVGPATAIAVRLVGVVDRGAVVLPIEDAVAVNVAGTRRRCRRRRSARRGGRRVNVVDPGFDGALAVPDLEVAVAVPGSAPAILDDPVAAGVAVAGNDDGMVGAGVVGAPVDALGIETAPV